MLEHYLCSTTRSIVEAHGGGISVKSTVGQGTTFTVRLPLSPAVMVLG